MFRFLVPEEKIDSFETALTEKKTAAKAKLERGEKLCYGFHGDEVIQMDKRRKKGIMNLLDYMSEQKKETESPLASRLRPTTLDEVVGQKHIIGKDKLLYRAIQADKLSSLIFYGPPGTG